MMAECIVLLSSDSEGDEASILPLIERISNKPPPVTKRKAKDSDDDELPSFTDFLKERKQPVPTELPMTEDPIISTTTTSRVQSTTAKRKRPKAISDVKEQQIEERKEHCQRDDDETNSKETKRQKLLKEKEAKKQERERKKAEKDQEKSLKKLVSQAENDSKKEIQPAHRVKQLVVQIDTCLSEVPELMTTLVSQLQELEVQYRVVPTASTSHTVTWRRKKVTRSLNEDMTNVIENTQEIDEEYMLVVMNGKEYVDHVIASKSEQSSTSVQPLVQHVRTLIREYPTRKIIIVVENLDAALRAQKTKRNRNFRKAVRTNQTDTETIVPQLEVSWFDCDSYMTELYLETESCVRLCSSPSQVADMIVTYTKAIADVPYKKDTSFFSFYGDLGPGASRKALQESKNEIGLIWQYQLQQYPGVSNPVAAAIVSHYPSPSHLLKAYSECSSKSEGDCLLKDIEVRRGAGIIASTRKVGPSISQRIHIAMTCEEPSNLLPN